MEHSQIQTESGLSPAHSFPLVIFFFVLAAGGGENLLSVDFVTNLKPISHQIKSPEETKGQKINPPD